MDPVIRRRLQAVALVGSGLAAVAALASLGFLVPPSGGGTASGDGGIPTAGTLPSVGLGAAGSATASAPAVSGSAATGREVTPAAAAAAGTTSATGPPTTGPASSTGPTPLARALPPVAPPAVVPARWLEAETFAAGQGVEIVPKDEASGGATVGYVENGDWVRYAGLPAVLRATTFTAQVSSNTGGGVIEVRDGSPDGAMLGSVRVPGTGSWERFTTVSTTLAPGSSADVYLRFTGGPGYLLDVDGFEIGPG